MFLLASECQLRESRLVARCVLDVDEVLVVRDAVVLRQLEQSNQSLQDGRPADERFKKNASRSQVRCYTQSFDKTIYILLYGEMLFLWENTQVSKTLKRVL